MKSLTFIGLFALACVPSRMERRQIRAARRAVRSVVKLEAETSSGPLAIACGVVVSKSGHILTANHVAEDAEFLKVLLPGGPRCAIQVLAADKTADLALIKVCAVYAEASGVRPARIGKSANLRLGQPILAVGNPFALGMSVTAGVVSALGRSFGVGRYTSPDSVVQVDASTNGGYSGGGLFDLNGNLVGIVMGGYYIGGGGDIGISFAVPIDRARTMLKKPKR